jgi:MarR family 2-MHQ and catechol resistance regulon transcriptional repressor
MNRTEESLKAFIGIKRTNEYLERHVKRDAVRHGLNITEFAVMELLYNKGDQPIQHIRNRILIASSTTYVVDKLVEKGFVERRPDTRDRRISFATLTDDGRKLMEEIFPPHAELITELFSGLSDGELSVLRETLKKITLETAQTK